MSEEELREYARGIHERVLTVDTHCDFRLENFTVENDEDFLWVKWDAAQNQDELFAWVKLRIIRPSASNPSAGGETRSSHLEPGAIYIGGIRDGEHRVSLIGMSHDGQLTKPQWFSFENPGDRCDPDRTACPQIISSF